MIISILNVIRKSFIYVNKLLYINITKECKQYFDVDMVTLVTRTTNE